MKKEKRVKHGGRKAGTPNKDTKELRERISDLIDVHFYKLSDDLLSLEPKERIEAMIKLFEYSLPKLQRMEFETNNNGAPLVWNETKVYAPQTLDDWYNSNRIIENGESE